MPGLVPQSPYIFGVSIQRLSLTTSGGRSVGRDAVSVPRIAPAIGGEEAMNGVSQNFTVGSSNFEIARQVLDTYTEDQECRDANNQRQNKLDLDTLVVVHAREILPLALLLRLVLHHRVQIP